MSHQSKGFWTAKGNGHINDGDAAFDNPSKIESKRTHPWFIDAAEVDFFPNKKQAVENENGKSGSGVSSINFSHWENNPNLSSVPNQFSGRLFGPESKPVNFEETNSSYVVGDNSNLSLKMISNRYIDDAYEEAEARLNLDGIKEVKANHVRNSGSVQAEARYNLVRQNSSDLHQANNNGGAEIGYMSIGHAFDKGSNASLMELSSNREDAHVRSLGEAYGKGDDNAVSLGDSFKDTNTTSFCVFPDEQDIFPVDRPSGDFGPLYDLSSVQVSTTADERVLNASNSSATVRTPLVDKLKPEPVSKNKPELKAAKKEAPNSFPSNVRSLISTGMLDGVPVKYVSVSREILRGIIKGSGYLCGCLSCNYSKVLNAYEFERHAGCKTKHPNNHIYFENGKTIYQIVQELKSTPESLLFDTMQTVFGAPINQKAFRNWKESFQAATRELQRIYGKNEPSI